MAWRRVDLTKVDKNIKPALDDLYNLGASTKKWAAFYAVLAVFTSMTIGSIYFQDVGGEVMINGSVKVNGSMNVTDNLNVEDNITGLGTMDVQTLSVKPNMVNSTGNTTLTLQDSSSNLIIKRADGNVKFFVNGSDEGIGIGTDSVYNSSALQIDSSDRGIIIPRLTAHQMFNISNKANGLIVYCTDCESGDGNYCGWYTMDWASLTQAATYCSKAGGK